MSSELHVVLCTYVLEVLGTVCSTFLKGKH